MRIVLERVLEIELDHLEQYLTKRMIKSLNRFRRFLCVLMNIRSVPSFEAIQTWLSLAREEMIVVVILVQYRN